MIRFRENSKESRNGMGIFSKPLVKFFQVETTRWKRNLLKIGKFYEILVFVSFSGYTASKEFAALPCDYFSQ